MYQLTAILIRQQLNTTRKQTINEYIYTCIYTTEPSRHHSLMY